MSDKRLALCLLTGPGDEERALAEALRQRARFDEVIIGWTGPPLGPRRQPFGVHVREVGWTGSAAAARRALIRTASADWVLLLDGAERVGRANLEALKERLDNSRANTLPVNLFSTLVEPGHRMRTAPIRLIRRSVADCVTYLTEGHQDTNVHGEPPPDLAIDHNGWASGETFRRTLRWLAKPTSPVEAGIRLGRVGRYAQAADTLLPHLHELSPEGLFWLLRSLVCQGRYEEAEKAARSGCLEHPVYTDLWYYLGLALKGQGSYAEAEATLQWCLELGCPPAIYPHLVGTGDSLAYYALGEVLEAKGELSSAVEAYRCAHTADPEDMRALADYARTVELLAAASPEFRPRAQAVAGFVLWRQGRDEEASAVWSNLADLPAREEAARLLLQEATRILLQGTERIPESLTLQRWLLRLRGAGS